MSETPPHKPKLIVDEDYKTRVQAEKEALRKQEAAGDSEDATSAETTSADSTEESLPPPPPASFSMLVTTLAAQAMTSLGLAPDPQEGKPVVRLELARHFIDTLDVLEEKTKGNLTPDELALMGPVLHELRMAYVAVKNNPPAEGDPPAAP